MTSKIPIFIITKDRLTVLKRSIESYKKCIKTPFRIVIHDNGSTYPPTVQYLNELEQEGIKVFRYNHKIEEEKMKYKDDYLNSVSISVEKMKKYYPFEYYVVTDPDIELYGDCGDILDVYKAILREKRVRVVGPILKLDDIPDYYPMKEAVLERKRHWSKPKLQGAMKYAGRRITFTRAKIDTVFGMYSRNFVFKRKQNGILVHSPYDARHLDWYIDPNNLAEDQLYYIKASKQELSVRMINHWSTKKAFSEVDSEV